MRVLPPSHRQACAVLLKQKIIFSRRLHKRGKTQRAHHARECRACLRPGKAIGLKVTKDRADPNAVVRDPDLVHFGFVDGFLRRHGFVMQRKHLPLVVEHG